MCIPASIARFNSTAMKQIVSKKSTLMSPFVLHSDIRAKAKMMTKHNTIVTPAILFKNDQAFSRIK